MVAKYGGKRIFGWFMFVCAVATVLMPVAARASPILLMFLRAVAGAGEVCEIILCLSKILLTQY